MQYIPADNTFNLLLIQAMEKLGQGLGAYSGRKKQQELAAQDLQALTNYNQQNQAYPQLLAQAQQSNAPLMAQNQNEFMNWIQDPMANAMNGGGFLPQMQGLNPTPQQPQFPNLQSPMGQQFALRQQMNQAMPVNKEPFTLSPGQTRYEEGRPIATLPDETKKQWMKPMALGKDNEYGLSEGTVIQYDPQGKMNIVKEPKEGFTPQDKAQLTTTYRKEFDSLSDKYRIVRDSYGRILASVKDPSAAGDLSLIFNYMKVLDPGSTVRESEAASVENARGVPAAIRNIYNKVIKGERLEKGQREDFASRSDMLFKSQATTQDKLIKRYEGLATRYGLSAEDITTPVDVYDQKSSPGTGNQTQQPSVDDITAELRRRGVIK